MVQSVVESVRYCNVCRHKTKHYKNEDRINWLMHLVLLVITAGLWLIVMILGACVSILNTPLCGPEEGWVCANCGKEN